jgi:antitoxin VapB
MSAERHVRVFRNGRSRAVRIPKELDIFGDEVVMRREGERVVIEAPRKRDLAEVLDYLRSLPPLGPDDQFPEIEDLPAEPLTDFDDIKH